VRIAIVDRSISSVSLTFTYIVSLWEVDFEVTVRVGGRGGNEYLGWIDSPLEHPDYTIKDESEVDEVEKMLWDDATIKLMEVMNGKRIDSL